MPHRTEKIDMQDDRAIADLLSTIARQYQKQIADSTISKNKTRLEIIRRLELIAQSIKGLMKDQQEKLAQG
jgi:hypothetical protein